MLKRPSTYVLLVTMFVALVTAVMPHWPAAVQTLQLTEPGQQQNLVFTLIGVSLALLTASLASLLMEQRHELGDLARRIETSVAGPVIRKLRDEQFYPEFLQAARQATLSVCICYFGPCAPDSVPDAHRRRYYKDILRLMTKRGDQIRFRRLVRSSHANDKWMAGVAKRLLGKPRIDLALLKDLDPEDPKNVMPLALSVQIVDQKSAWIVAVQAHEQTGEYRDVVVEGGELPKTLQLYFDRLWRHSEVILDSGTLTPAGHALIARVDNQELP